MLREVKFDSDAVENLRTQYPKGTEIMLIHMADDPQPVPGGTKGIVTYIDDIGNIGVHWANGSTLSLVPGVDSFKVISIPAVAKRKDIADLEKTMDAMLKMLLCTEQLGDPRNNALAELRVVEYPDDSVWVRPIFADGTGKSAVFQKRHIDPKTGRPFLHGYYDVDVSGESSYGAMLSVMDKFVRKM